MAFDIELVKKHPYAIGGLVLGLIVLYLIVRRGGSSSGSSDSGSSGATAGYDSAASIQMAQISAQQSIAETQAQVQNNGIIAAAQSHDLETAAQLQLGTLQVQADVLKTLGVAQIQADEQTHITDVNDSSQVQIALANDQAKVDVAAVTGDTALGVAAYEAQAKEAAIQGQVAVATSQTNLEEDYLHTLASQHKLGGSSTGVTQIADAILSGGKTGAASIAANQPATVAGDNAAAGIISAAGGLAKGLFGGL